MSSFFLSLWIGVILWGALDLYWPWDWRGNRRGGEDDESSS